MKFAYKPKGGVPIKAWVNKEAYYSDKKLIEQAENLSCLPFVYKWIALSADAHMGYGMPIGGIMATREVVVPNAVGVDIGCGMLAVKTQLKNLSIQQVKDIMGLVRKEVPVGFNHNKHPNEAEMPTASNYIVDTDTIVMREYQSATHQIGTLGGGNHFIELQKGSDGYIWFMVHSGSRNLGYKVAKHYNEKAKELNKKWYSSVDKNCDLAFLPIESDEGVAYIEEMSYCLDFAKANRYLMAKKIKKAFYEVTENNEFDRKVDIHHNYASLENHYGKNVIVHRKGATLAREGAVGIIPGSQGTASYIVIGKGNPESFYSCSHGAGRIMGRKQAKRELDLETETKKLEELGIVHSIRSKDDLDEASGAYKNIDEVMENQKDLVKIDVKLEPLGVIKA